MMEVPKEIMDMIKAEAENYIGSGSYLFVDGAIFAYNLSQEEIEVLERQNRVIESQLVIADAEVERLKALIGK